MKIKSSKALPVTLAGTTQTATRTSRKTTREKKADMKYILALLFLSVCSCSVIKDLRLSIKIAEKEDLEQNNSHGFAEVWLKWFRSF
ncbi:hypothetical protein N9955_00430 [bacterium]|nr:hypothetical protein [bacterium]